MYKVLVSVPEKDLLNWLLEKNPGIPRRNKKREIDYFFYESWVTVDEDSGEEVVEFTILKGDD